VQCCRYVMMDGYGTSREAVSISLQRKRTRLGILIFNAVVTHCRLHYIVLFTNPAGYFMYNGRQFVFCSAKVTITSRKKKRFYGV